MVDEPLGVDELLRQLPEGVRTRVGRLEHPDLGRQLTSPVPALDGRTLIEAAQDPRNAEFVDRVLDHWDEFWLPRGETR